MSNALQRGSQYPASTRSTNLQPSQAEIPNTTTTTRVWPRRPGDSHWRLSVVAFAAATFAAACSSGAQDPLALTDSPAVITVAPSSSSSETYRPMSPQEEIEMIRSREVAPPRTERSADFESSTGNAPRAPETNLEFGDEPLPAGRVATDLMGTAITFEVPEDPGAVGGWLAVGGDPGGLIVVGANTTTPTSETILVTRMNSFGGDSDIDTEPQGIGLSGPSDDFDAWLTAGEFVIEKDETVQLGNTQARAVDLVVDPNGTRSLPGGCGPEPEDRCVFVGGTSSESLAFFIVRTTEVYRFYFIEQEGFDPILVTAIAHEDNRGFLDDADDLVKSIELGTAKPHPVQIDGPLHAAGRSAVVPAGVVYVPALDGITFEMEEDRFVVQDQNLLIIESNEAPADELFAPAVIVALLNSTSEGGATAANSAAQVLEAVRADSQVTETGDQVEVFGITFTGYRVEADNPEVPPSHMFSPARPGQVSNIRVAFGPHELLYLADNPDGGVYALSYGAFSEESLALSKTIFDEVVATLAIAMPPGAP